MALIDHIHRCNRWNAAHYLPFWVEGHPVGRIGPEIAARLADFPALFRRDGRAIALSERLDSPKSRSDALRPVVEKLAAEGLIGPLRGEDYRVASHWGTAPLMAMERAAVPAFGIRAYGIHVNGLVRRADGPWLWIGKRAADRAVEPGKLDNMVAGGQPAELSLEENLIKEAAEEAGLPEAIARRAKPVGAISYCMAEGIGLKRDTLFLYDLELAEGGRSGSA
jgi:8-oxo-dGTP pyrophosphatase MutT (NUDIX family)